jgi:hypothetical protein
MRQEITCSQFMAELDSWVGRGVAIRVTAPGGALLAVFHGVLRERSDEKHPATFWPLVHSEPIERLDHLERPAVYLHRVRWKPRPWTSARTSSRSGRVV